MDVKDWQFPTACPKCNGATEFPHQVITTDALIFIEIRCRSCLHHWVASAPSPPLVAKRKKDRRQAERGAHS
jgi:uncharacterized Zn finger protein